MLPALKRHLVLFLALGAMAMPVAYGGPAATSGADAATEFKALFALRHGQMPPALRSGGDEVAKVAWYRWRKAQLQDRGAAFLERYATDPLRWDVLVLMRYGAEDRERIYRSGARQLIPVPESADAWNRIYFPRLEALLAAPDAGAAARGEALRQLIDQTASHALWVPAEAPQAIARTRAWLEQYDREYPRSSDVFGLYHTYANLLDDAAPDLCLAFLADLERRYDRGERLDKLVQEIVAGHRRALEAQALPVDKLWTELRKYDPVVGDPARYRGQVVLLAIGPVTYDTFTEGIEDLYAQYHAAGLVILQVASFNGNYGLPPEREQRQVLEKILAVQKWPWPVLWNPQGHLELVKQWGYNSVPVWMLIGRDGRLIADRHSPLSVTIPRELVRAAPPEAPAK